MPNEKNYVSIINNGTEAIWIKDAESRTEIDKIKQRMKSALQWIGNSVSPIADTGFLGPWTIDGIEYNSKFIAAGGSSQLKYMRYGVLDDVLSGGTMYYAWVLFKSAVSIDNTVVYTLSENPEQGDDLFDSSGTMITDKVDSLHAPRKVAPYNEFELVPGMVAVYKADEQSREVEYIWGANGWSIFGEAGSFGNLAFVNDSDLNLTGSVSSKLVQETVHDTPSLTTGTLPTMTYNGGTETLTFNAGAFPQIVAGTEKTFATGGVANDGTGTSVVTTAPSGVSIS